MLLPLLLVLATPTPPRPPRPPRAPDQHIAVRLNHDQLEVGDRAKIYVKTDQDGYIVILHADPQGRVRVLFPLDPTDDNFVRGGREFELRGRSDREPIEAYTSGTGTVLAAFSPDTFTFDELTRNGHWDFAALGGPDESLKRDPLAGLLEIVNNMARGNQFDYDVATYLVPDRVAESTDEYGGHSHFGIGLAFGYAYPFGVGFAFGYPYPYAFFPFWGWYGGFGYPAPYYYGYRYGFPVSRPLHSTPVIYTSGYFGSGNFTRKGVGVQPTFTPVQVRPRGGVTQPVAIGNRGLSNPISGRSRGVQPRGISPRGRSGSLRLSNDGPSISRGFGGISKTFGGISRSFGGFGGSRGGFGGFSGGRGIGGRRH